MSEELIWRIPKSDQYITFTDEVLEHFNNYKQKHCLSKEAGGQLFASILDNHVIIEFASGPYKKDKRTRTSYRSDPKSAQETIDKEFKKGRLYVGEWHTHREKKPISSSYDKATIKATLDCSKHPYDLMILVIKGLIDSPDGLSVFVQSSNDFVKILPDRI